MFKGLKLPKLPKINLKGILGANPNSKKKTKTMFTKAQRTDLAKDVSIENPSQARQSVTKLNSRYKQAQQAGDRQEMIEIKRSQVLAANRARAQLKRKNLSSKEKQEMRDVAQIYERSAKSKTIPPKQ